MMVILAEGHGSMIYSGGDRYEGNWKNDIPEGDGVYYYKSGAIYTGYFKNGEEMDMEK